MSGNGYGGGNEGDDGNAYWQISKRRFAELRTPEYVAEQDHLYDMAQAVGERENAQRIHERKRLTWYHNDFGVFAPKIWITPKQLAERYAEITAITAELEPHKNTQPQVNAEGNEEDDAMANNTNGFPSRETVARLRQQYPAGTRVELVSMDDPYTTLRRGDKGAVAFVDDAGGIHVNWDSGSQLALLYGIDSFKAIHEPVYENGGAWWRDKAEKHDIHTAYNMCGDYLAKAMKRELSDSDKQFCKEVFAAMFEATAGWSDAERIVYPYELSESMERLGRAAFDDSLRANIQCARAINDAINASRYKANHYHLDIAAMAVVREYGFERVNAVLANYTQRHSSDGRISAANKEWASGFTLPEKPFTGAHVSAHATLVNDFAKYAREMYKELNAERFALPGHEEHGEMNAGYEIILAITFKDMCGYVIGRSPDNPDDCVTWQFRIRDGERVYNHGCYCGDMKEAADSYLARVAAYMSDGTREIPNPISAVADVEAVQPGKDGKSTRDERAATDTPQAPAVTVEQERSDGYTLHAHTAQLSELGVAVNYGAIAATAMPEYQLNQADMNDYGYLWPGMQPLTREEALAFFDSGHSVLRLYPDDTEGYAESREEIEKFDGMFGLEIPGYVEPEIAEEPNRADDGNDRRPIMTIVCGDGHGDKRADDYTSVLDAIKKGKEAPKPPRKAKGTKQKAKGRDDYDRG